MLPRQTLEYFDGFLEARGLRLNAIVVGGSALVLIGIIDRPTRDVDVLHPDLPPQIAEASRAFALEMRQRGVELADTWLNNGPSSLSKVLPDGWRLRAQPAFSGRALVLETLGRTDLLKTKLFALCDRGTDLADCIAFSPTAEELEEALPWVAQQDANALWPSHVEQTMRDLGRRLGHDV
ncbi:MAG: hypothetical protein RL685_5261 [Pseudomonadota bacterium]|jgi:hypothetical protein